MLVSSLNVKIREMRKTKNFWISSGYLKDDNKAEDIAYWQMMTPEQRFIAASEMAQSYEDYIAKQSNRCSLKTIDKSFIEFGSYGE